MVNLPCCAQLDELRIEPIRSQYLGLIGETHACSAEVPDNIEAPPQMRWMGLRQLLGLVNDAFLSLAGHALQIMDWDRSHQFCGHCATPTLIKPGERNRLCPNCGQAHYPRIAPVAMALVRRDDMILLARSAHFPPGMFSALAGFVEPGETVEECLIREVREEVGVEVQNLRYFGSQSWPFPHSLMLAFHADYAGGTLRCDDQEIEAADWFTVRNLPRLPHAFSIARRLIDAAVVDIQGH